MYQEGKTALQLAREQNKQPVVEYLSRKQHEHSIMMELHRLCEVGDASAVADLLHRQDATTIASIFALPAPEVQI